MFASSSLLEKHIKYSNQGFMQDFFSAEAMLMSMCKGFMGVLVHLLGFCRNPGYF